MRYRFLALILGPFVMWSLYFITVYGVQAVGCRAGWDTAFSAGIPVLRWILGGILALSAIVSASIYVMAVRMSTDHMIIKTIGRYCAAAGLFSTLLIFPGILLLELC